MNIEQSITLCYPHQSNDKIEACIKFVKCKISKCLITNNGVNLPLLQIKSTLLGAGLSSLATPLFNRLISGLLPQMNSKPIDVNNDDA